MIEFRIHDTLYTNKYSVMYYVWPQKDYALYLCTCKTQLLACVGNICIIGRVSALFYLLN